jgi:hypothetical protein
VDLTINSGLASLFSGLSSTGTGDPVLNALYGIGGQSTGSLRNPIPALTMAEQNQSKDIATTAKQPQIARDIAAFGAAVSAAKNPAALLKNPIVMKILLTANGLADQLSYPALAGKALLSNVNDTKSLVNRLNDTRWKTVVQTYDFANNGLSILQNPKVISTIANGYAEVTWRKSLDAATPGLSNALSFRESAGSITSVDQILGDPTLRTVITTTLGIPEQIAFQTLRAQENAISSKLDITKFKDPKFVETFTRRYLIAAGAAASTTTGTTPNLTTLAVQARGLLA